MPSDNASSSRFDLPRDRIVRLTRARGTRIDCLSGSAWITVDGERRDVVLAGGESLIVESQAPVIVQAVLGPAQVVLRPQMSEGGPRLLRDAKAPRDAAAAPARWAAA